MLTPKSLISGLLVGTLLHGSVMIGMQTTQPLHNNIIKIAQKVHQSIDVPWQTYDYYDTKINKTFGTATKVLNLITGAGLAGVVGLELFGLLAHPSKRILTCHDGTKIDWIKGFSGLSALVGIAGLSLRLMCPLAHYATRLRNYRINSPKEPIPFLTDIITKTLIADNNIENLNGSLVISPECPYTAKDWSVIAYLSDFDNVKKRSHGRNADILVQTNTILDLQNVSFQRYKKDNKIDDLTQEQKDKFEQQGKELYISLIKNLKK